MDTIRKEQIQTIYALGGRLGIVDRSNHEDELHELVAAISGSLSVKSLSGAAADELIADLRRRAGTVPKSPAKATDTPPGGMSAGQQKKVWRLMYALADCDLSPGAPVGERLCGVIRRELTLDATPAFPFRWLDYRSGGRLIEVLKGYIITAQRMKARGEDGSAGSDHVG